MPTKHRITGSASQESAAMSPPRPHSSFWERHKERIYKFGHYYATVCGLIMINYIPARSTSTWTHRAAIAYSHVLSLVVIVLLPVYFGYNFETLIASEGRSGKLQVLVHFTNTLLKWLSVIVTYSANLIYFSQLLAITRVRQRLEDVFGVVWSKPRRQFERMLLFKFGIINAMLLSYWLHLGHEIWLNGALSVRVHFEVYTFMLWNYTENMADYFYFINSSALKFYRQLKTQIAGIYASLGALEKRYRRQQGRKGRRGLFVEHCCKLSDRFNVLAGRYLEIYALTQTSIRIQQFQILGLVLMTLISNLTNFFTLFDLLTHSTAPGGRAPMPSSNCTSETPSPGTPADTAAIADTIPQIIFSIVYTLFFYIDTYIVALISDQIHEELRRIGGLLRRFNEFYDLDIRLEQTIEYFTLLLRNCKTEFRICGLFTMDRRLTYLTACTGLSYFITLVQFNVGFQKVAAN